MSLRNLPQPDSVATQAYFFSLHNLLLFRVDSCKRCSFYGSKPDMVYLFFTKQRSVSESSTK